jgi:hypothetical protein
VQSGLAQQWVAEAVAAAGCCSAVGVTHRELELEPEMDQLSLRIPCLRADMIQPWGLLRGSGGPTIAGRSREIPSCDLVECYFFNLDP